MEKQGVVTRLKNLWLAIGLFRNWPVFVWCYLRHPSVPMNVRMKSGLHLSVRPGTSDFLIIREVLVWGDYEPPGFEIGKNFIVVDVGAQIGVFSVMAARKASSGRVISFEPHPENHALLQKNKEENGLHHMKIHNRAVAACSGPLTFYISSFNTGGHSIVSSEGSREALTVEGVRLDEILQSESVSHIDYLKMDCEGAEVQILHGMKPDILQSIDRIVMEIHDPADATPDGLAGWLRDRGYEVDVREFMVYARRLALQDR